MTLLPGCFAPNMVDTTNTTSPGPCADAAGLAEILEDGIYQFWNELCDIGTVAIDSALTYCKRTLCNWNGAQNAFWMAAVHIADKSKQVDDKLHGGHISSVEMLHAEHANDALKKQGVKVEYTKELAQAAAVVMSAAGRFRVYSLGAWIAESQRFRDVDHYEIFYRQPGIVDRMWVIFPVSEDIESIFVFDCKQGDRLFSACELRLVADTLRGIKWFHRNLLFSRGLGEKPSTTDPGRAQDVAALVVGCDGKNHQRSAQTHPGNRASIRYRDISQVRRPWTDEIHGAMGGRARLIVSKNHNSY